MKRRVIYSARSHVGKRRENNEDNLFSDGIILPSDIGNRPFSLDGVTNAPSIFAVCDGMGGEESGEVASRLVMETLQAEAEQLCRTAPRQLPKAVQRFVERGHQAVQDRVEGARSGATLAIAAFTNTCVFCFNLGDSRIYCLQSGHFRRVTNDHTVAGDQLRRGLCPPEEVRRDCRLTRCIGIGLSQAAEAYPAIKGDCRLLICSDGLTDMVGDEELAKILFSLNQPSEAADSLIQAALRYGGRDNVTAIVLDATGVSRFRFW